MANRQKDYYGILELTATATAEQIRSAYLRLARQHHPDLNPGSRSAEERFKAVSEAYEILSDPEQRRRVDEALQNLAAKRRQTAAQARRDHAKTSSRRSSTIAPARKKAGLGEFIQGLLGIKVSKAAAGASKSKVPRAPSEQRLVLSLEDAHRGGVHRLTIFQRRKCPACLVKSNRPLKGCITCAGSGRVMTPATLDVNIPPGARDGAIVKIPHPGATPSSNSIYVRIAIAPHPVFRVRGDDIEFDISISPWEAIFGGAIHVPTLEGKPFELRIRERSQTGARVKLRGHGLSRRDGARGDAYVTFNIAVPDDPTEEEKSAYRQLARVSRPVRRTS